MLQQSCRRYGIGLTLFGWGQPYPSHNWKLQCQREALFELADDYRYVLFLDVFDSVFVADLASIFERFDELDTPFVMSAEINCHPPEGPSADDYPPSPTAYRFVNAGGYMGKTSTIVEILQRFDGPGFSDQPEDQGFWAKVFVSGETDMSLDYHNRIFQCLWLAEQDMDFGAQRLVGQRALRQPRYPEHTVPDSRQWFLRYGPTLPAAPGLALRLASDADPVRTMASTKARASAGLRGLEGLGLSYVFIPR